MNGYEKRTQNKKQLILQNAQELFFEKGYINIKIADIARVSKVSQVTIYNYFQSKEQLLIEVLRKSAHELICESEKILASNFNFPEKFKKISIMKQKLYSVIYNDILKLLSSDNNTIEAALIDISKNIATPFLNRFLEMGKKSGDIDESISLEALLAFSNAVTMVMSQTDYLNQSEEYQKSIERLYLYGLLGK